MKNTNLFVLLLSTLYIISCSSIPNLPPPDHRVPSANASVVYLRDGTYINSENQLKNLRDRLNGSRYFYDNNRKCFVWDLNGGILDGRHQRGDGGQSEDQEPLFRCNIPLVVRNGFVRNNKDAMMFNEKDSGIINMTWLNVGEDAVSTHRNARNFLIQNCEFINHRKGDKSIQLNNGARATLRDNIIFSGRTGVRLFSSINSSSDTAISENNKFIGNDTGYNIEYGTLTSTNDSFNRVRLPFKLVNGAKIKK